MLSDLHYSEPADPTQAPVSSQQTHHRVVCNLNRAGTTDRNRVPQTAFAVSNRAVLKILTAPDTRRTSIRLLH